MKHALNRRKFLKGLAVSSVELSCGAGTPERKNRPNIVWILAEDASPHIGSYGDPTIRTPNLDAMAASGVRFENVFVTCPVCSPSRSAMITGMYQTTLGAHNHRSQADQGKGAGSAEYFDSYRLPVPLIPELFQDAGYYVTNGAGPTCEKPGKTDYNFIWPKTAYDGADWRACPADRPFFAQIMLSGGKARKAKEYGTDPASVTLPPYYPDTPLMRDDWADYINSWGRVDTEIGEIFQSLEAAGVADNTVVFFLTDHGVSHLRGKQFLYEEGIRVPLIVRFPDGQDAGQTRQDLAVQIDLAATWLSLAGIPIPAHVQGRDLFADSGGSPEMVFCARDRCDETVDIIRCVRTGRYKYSRNFLSHISHMQPNQYKDAKAINQEMRRLHREGRLNAVQDRIFDPQRPPEELYDLQNDPHETQNLAGDVRHGDTLARLRSELYAWMLRSRDMGLIPEPILEDLGRQHGNKYYVLQKENAGETLRAIIAVIEAGEKGDVPALTTALASESPALRWWAATGLGRS